MTFSVSTLCLASGAPLLFRIDSHLLRGLGAALLNSLNILYIHHDNKYF